MARDMDLPVFLFTTTTEVMWAEEVAQEKGIPVEVVPAPRGYGDLCGLALRVASDAASSLETLLAAEGIPHRRHG